MRSSPRASPSKRAPARDAEERLAIWKGRKSAFSAVGRLSPDFIVQDGVVPRRRLGEALRRIGEMTRESRAALRECVSCGRRQSASADPLRWPRSRRARSARRRSRARILKMCVEMGGSITGEHGIGVEKRDYLPDMFTAGRDRLHEARCAPRSIRMGIANPGKMFPGGEAPGAAAARPASAGEGGRDFARMRSPRMDTDLRSIGPKATAHRINWQHMAAVYQPIRQRLVEAVRSAAADRRRAGTKPRLSDCRTVTKSVYRPRALTRHRGI